MTVTAPHNRSVTPSETNRQPLTANSSNPADIDRRQPILNSPYPSSCKSILLNFLDLIEAKCWSQSEASKKIKHGPNKNHISPGALSQLLSGTYKADPVAICASIERALNLESGRAIFSDKGFVKTRLYKLFTDMADIACITQGITCIHGGLLAGKTTNATALAHLYDRATPVYMTAPYADSYAGFIRRLAAVRGIEPRGNLSDLRERILSALDQSHLLIVDEFHQPICNYPFSQAKRCYEFLREINDLCRCGILLVGASTGYHSITVDFDFERLDKTIIAKDISLAIPTKGKNETDLLAICKTYGLPEPTQADADLCKAIVEQVSVGRLFDILRLAHGSAERLGQTLDWTHVRHVQTTLLKLN